MEWRCGWWAGAPVVSNATCLALVQSGPVCCEAVYYRVEGQVNRRELRVDPPCASWAPWVGVGRRARIDGREAERWELLVILR